MSTNRSRIPSPAQSVGSTQKLRRGVPSPSLAAPTTLRRVSRRSSGTAPLRRHPSGSFQMSPPNRQSILTDNTEIDVPGRRSWWKKLSKNSIEVGDVLVSNVPQEENFNLGVICQVNPSISNMQRKQLPMNLDIVSDGSTSESLGSIDVPQRELFTHRPPQNFKQFENIINRQESLKKNKTKDIDKTIAVSKKDLFSTNKPKKNKHKPYPVPGTSINVTSNNTRSIVIDAEGLKKKLFGNRQQKKLPAFENFIMSESEDETTLIQERLTAFKKNPSMFRQTSRRASKRPISPASSVYSETMEMENWKLLPSSTMVGEDIITSTPAKKLRRNEAMDEMHYIEEQDLSLPKNCDLEGVEKAVPGLIIRNVSKRFSKPLPSDAEINENIHKSPEEIVVADGSNHCEDQDGQNDEIVNNKNKCQETLDEKENNGSNNIEDAEQASNGPVDQNNKEVELSKSNVKSKFISESKNLLKSISDSDLKSKAKDTNQDSALANQSVFEKTVEKSLSEVHKTNVSKHVSKPLSTELEKTIEQADFQNEYIHSSPGKIDGVNKSNNKNEEGKQNISLEKSYSNKSKESDKKLIFENSDEGNNIVEQNSDKISESDINNVQNELEDEGEDSVKDIPSSDHKNDSKAKAHTSAELGSFFEKVRHEKALEKSKSGPYLNTTQTNTKQVSELVTTESEGNEDINMKQVDDQNETHATHQDIEVEDEADDSDGCNNDNQGESHDESDDQNHISDDKQDIDDAEKTHNSTDGQDSDEVTEEVSKSDVDNDSDVEEEKSLEDVLDTSVAHCHTSEDEDDFRVNSISKSQNRFHSTPDMGAHSIEIDDIRKDTSANLSQRRTFENISKWPCDEINIDPIIESNSELSNRCSVEFSKNMSSGPRSSTEGSGWNSHTTHVAKVAEQTMNIRKSLRTLVLDKAANMRPPTKNISQTLGQDTSDTSILNRSAENKIQTIMDDYVKKIREENLVQVKKIQEKAKSAVKTVRSDPNLDARYFQYQANPAPRKANNKVVKLAQSKRKNAQIAMIDGTVYKPPKLFKPPKAPWINKHFYQFLYEKLKAKYQYNTRLESEKFVQLLFSVYKYCIQKNADVRAPMNALKKRMAQLGLVTTHFDFYVNFVEKYMPKDFRVKVIPDIVNRLPLPNDGLFSEIIPPASQNGSVR